MQLTQLDWIVVCLYIAVTLVTGLYFARRAGRQTDEFFLGGRSMPWWLLGTSMVATTFSTDTPNLVTDLVRTGGVSENWIWWAMGISGMCTVFFYAQLWRRSNILTDVGFYELRYSGRPAAFLRGFRALYLGIFFNVMIMATVTLAAIKIGGVLLGVSKYEVILIAGTVTALYSATSGFWGVVVTDLLLFIVAMTGSLAAAYYAVQQPAVGGLNGLFTNPALEGKLALLPDFTDLHSAAAIFIIPIAVQWWSTWYPGAEPGGGGYIAQRMLAAKDESHALKATLWFNLAHYALRPWPWIIVALASLIVYPTLDSIQAAFPTVDPSIVRHDLAYPAMLVFLPSGLLGLVVASLAAAYMSTISTHLNWGASYIIDDWYRRFISPDREDRHYLRLARLATIGLIILAGIVSLWLENALQAFQILLQIGAGTGLVFLLRWFWWRINAWSEISAMIISFLIAVYFQFVHTNILGLEPLEPSFQLVLGVLLTSIGWVTVTLLTPPASPETLKSFHQLIRPMGGGWRGAGLGLEPEPNGSSPTAAFLAWFLGCIAIYGALFGTGYALYGRNTLSLLCITIAALAILWLFRLLPKIDLR
ncbi:MAG: sodium:solute symporter family protein [Gemmatimonadota bacterium]|nr:Na+:solute symporter [Gemmatimonadota bacterium]MEC7808381.1 sodium:solute symporter family protein [Gemmatimonadota bacterium]MEC9317805.1 sodium:solute symporter family protein [Gemmatimonadota bacterium]